MNGDEQERLSVELELEIRRTRKLLGCIEQKLAGYRKDLQTVVDVLSGTREASTPKSRGTEALILLLVEGNTRRELKLPKLEDIAATLKEQGDAVGELETLQRRQGMVGS